MKIKAGKIFNKLSRLAMVSLIFVAAMAAMAIPTAKAPPPVGNAIYVDPPSQTVTVCTNFTVYVNLTFGMPGYKIIAFHLFFDPNLVECIGVTNTSFPSQIVTFLTTIDNTTGFVMVLISSDSDIFSIDPETIANITFHCKGAGTSFLNFTYVDIGPPTEPFYVFNGTCNQVEQPVGGEVLTIDALALLIPWIAAAGAVAVATVLVLASRRTFNR